jgi:chemotaxis signal transduction protein
MTAPTSPATLPVHGAAVKRLTLVIPSRVAAMTLRDRMLADELINFLIARVGTERFAIDLGFVLEAVDADGLEQIPRLPEHALGVLRWRGAVHTLWSPAGVLRAPLAHADTALFLRGDAAPVAMAVDDVEDLVTLAGSAVRPVQGVDDGEGLIAGVVHIGESLATVLDPPVLARAFVNAGAILPMES